MAPLSPATPLWTPSPQRIAGARITAFRQQVAGHVGSGEPAAIHEWSVRQPGEFWREVANEAVHCGDVGDGAVVIPQGAPPGSTFLPDARVCYAEELLAGAELAGANEIAIVYRREDGWRETLTWAQLRAQVYGFAARLRTYGVGMGDRVAAWLPNCPEAVVAMLATNVLGAIYTSASPDFGPQALADRFAQVAPVVLLAADGYHYAGRAHQRWQLLPEVVSLVPSVHTVFMVSELNRDTNSTLHLNGLSGLAEDLVGVALVSFHASDESEEPTPTAHRTGYDQPAVILYSSGTTGRPKCLAHSGLGLLLKHWTEHALHCDIKAGDVVFFYTTTGWMMWNWLVGALAVGATIMIFDGSPLAPDVDQLWRFAAAENVTFFGAGAKFYDSCRSAQRQPGSDFANPQLRTVASTGSPLSPADFEYLYDQWGAAIHLASISGGTDICGCFVLGDPTLPVYAGEIQSPALGVDVDVVDAAGDSLRTQPGLRGDLVCRNVLPSMPLRFWGDVDGSAYRSAYFSGYPDVWTHGDFAEWTSHGGIVISGRSDATLNVGGVRIGTAEIYRQLVAFPEIVDALAVAVGEGNESRVVLFVQLAAEATLDDELRHAIRSQLRTHASPRHVPAEVIDVPDLPRTRSGKLAELVVADIVNGRPIRPATGLANPQALDWFVAYAAGTAT